MRTLVIATIASLGLVGAASAQEMTAKPYINAGVTQHHTSNTDTASITGRFGADFNKNFALEAEGGFGVTNDTVLGAKLKQRGDLGAYAVGKLPIDEKFSVLGRLGYHETWAQAKSGTTTVKDNNGSFAAGVGAQYMFDEKNGIRGDYTRFTENDGVNNFAVAYVHKF